MTALLLFALLSAAPKPCTEAVDLEAGGIAPCDGVEIPEQDLDDCHAAEDARDQLAIDLKRKGIDLEQAQKDAKAADAAAKVRLDACQDGWDACAARVEVPAVVRVVEPRRWYASPWFGGVAGFVVGVGVTVAIVYAVR